MLDDWAPSVALSKVSFASNYFYDVGMGFPKMSMLAFYWGIFPTERRALRKAVYIVTAYVCTAYFVVLWIDTFYCGIPVSVQWSQEEGACSVFYATTPFYFNFAMNLSSYVFGKITHRLLKRMSTNQHLLVYALPLFLLPGMRKDHKAAIYFTFSLGIIPALTCMIRFIVLTVETGEPNLVCAPALLDIETPDFH